MNSLHTNFNNGSSIGGESVLCNIDETEQKTAHSINTRTPNAVRSLSHFGRRTRKFYGAANENAETETSEFSCSSTSRKQVFLCAAKLPDSVHVQDPPAFLIKLECGSERLLRS